MLVKTTEKLSDLEYQAWKAFLVAHDRVWRGVEVGMARLWALLAPADEDARDENPA